MHRNLTQEIQKASLPGTNTESDSIVEVEGDYVLVDNPAHPLKMPPSPYTDRVEAVFFNIACLTIIGDHQINEKFLRPNSERVEKIAEVLIRWNEAFTALPIAKFVNGLIGNSASIVVSYLFSQVGEIPPPPDIVGFAEGFHKENRRYLIDKLTPYYPFNSGEAGEKPLNAGSGLLVFIGKKYDPHKTTVEFTPYTNQMFGEEWLANKGWITAKCVDARADLHCFDTFIITHLAASGAINKQEQSKKGGTASARRGEEMGRIYIDLQTKGDAPPISDTTLTHRKSFVLGDFNAPLQSERQRNSISTGFSNNGYKQGQTKYPGQFFLFTLLENDDKLATPTNFREVRVLPTQKGRKLIDPDLWKQAVAENKYTGSTIPVSSLTANKETGKAITRQDTEFNVIDGAFISKQGVAGHCESELISFNELYNKLTGKSDYPYSLSDHHALRLTFFYDKSRLAQTRDDLKLPGQSAPKSPRLTPISNDE